MNRWIHSVLAGVYEFTATINAETYERVWSDTQRLRPAAWAIVKKGEEDKVNRLVVEINSKIFLNPT